MVNIGRKTTERSAGYFGVDEIIIAEYDNVLPGIVIYFHCQNLVLLISLLETLII